jgi:hypothetical protein
MTSARASATRCSCPPDGLPRVSSAVAAEPNQLERTVDTLIHLRFPEADASSSQRRHSPPRSKETGRAGRAFLKDHRCPSPFSRDRWSSSPR